MEFAAALGTGITNPDGRGYMNIQCPFAKWKHQGGTDSKPSFGIMPSSSSHSKGHCFACKSGGTLRDVVAELQMLGYEAADWQRVMQLLEAEDDDVPFPDFDDDEDGPKHPFHLYPEDWLMTFKPALQSPTACNYLQSRGFTHQQIEDWDIRWDGTRKRVCWPIRDDFGRLVGMQGRAIEKGVEPRYLQYRHLEQLNPFHMLGEHRIDPDRPVVLVEGPPDAMAVSAVYRNVLSLNGTSLTEERLERLEKYFEFVTMFDPDAAGKHALKTLKSWGYGKKVVYEAQFEDSRDPAELSAVEIVELLSEFIPDHQLSPT